MDSGRPSLPHLATNLPTRDRRLTSQPSKENVPIKRTDTPVSPQEDPENIPPPLTGFLYGIPAKPLVAKVESPVARTKQLYYEDAFACRSPHNSPQERVVRASVVVAELKTNLKVCTARSVPWTVDADFHPSPRSKVLSSHAIWHSALRRSTNGQNPTLWFPANRMPASSSTHLFPRICSRYMPCRL